MWRVRFEEPIRLSTGKAIHTLRDAAEHVIALPQMETRQGHWQNALACLLAAKRTGRVKTARMAMVKALAVSQKAPPSERLRSARSYKIIR